MPALPSERIVGQVLPGTWVIGATNLPVWLDGERSDFSVTFELSSESPLTILEEHSFTTAEGKQKSLTRVNRWYRGVFQSKGTSVLRSGSSRWRVIGLDSFGDIVVLKVDKTRGNHDGFIVLARLGTDAHELRSQIAGATEKFGLRPEDFASLFWLEIPVQSALGSGPSAIA